MIKDSEINQFLILGQKYCTKCLHYKDKELFVRDTSKSCGYYSSCISCNKDRRKKYYLENSDAVKEKVKLWSSKDSSTRILVALRKGLSSLVKGIGKNDKTLNYIGTTKEGLKTHLESLFKDGMSWENYGRGGWHVDHIKPCVLFDFTNEDDIFLCYNYKNLQPLWETDNCAKGSLYKGVRYRKSTKK